MTSAKSGNKPIKRCAIYTRKSHEEGLDQEFNSLDAQREACEAFATSQKHEGWKVCPEHYDDGGISGATMERPALKRLLADIDRGAIDIVIVYKVDRLTRSLTDFAKIVDAFDTRDVSFVSVTQQFNTSTSMGRLTLNVLLSFAQFEREVTAERIRDKIAASKKKGLWMGGTTPLGYDVKDRKLMVNADEADAVRRIFEVYLETRSVARLKQRLNEEGIVSKRRVLSNGKQIGGKPLMRGALYNLLRNPIYRGMIRHKEHAYPGAHQAIIDESVWDAAQRQLVENRVERDVQTRACAPSPLAGKLYDADGDRMTPSHANKNGVRYRYYITQSLLQNDAAPGPNALRLPAEQLDRAVSHRIGQWLADPRSAQDLDPDRSVRAQSMLAQSMARGASEWVDGLSDVRHGLLRRFVHAVRLRNGVVEIDLLRPALVEWLCEDPSIACATNISEATDIVSVTAPFCIVRRGNGVRIVMRGAGAQPVVDDAMIRLLIRARRIATTLADNPSITVNDIAEKEGCVRSYVTRLHRLNMLAPDIVEAIAHGTQPPSLTASKLMDNARLPLFWSEQRKALGFI